MARVVLPRRLLAGGSLGRFELVGAVDTTDVLRLDGVGPSGRRRTQEHLQLKAPAADLRDDDRQTVARTRTLSPTCICSRSIRSIVLLVAWKGAG